LFPFLTRGLRELWNAPGATIRVQAECARLNRISFPRWERVRWEIPARGPLPPVTITWHHGSEYAPGTRDLIHGNRCAFPGCEPHAKEEELQRLAWADWPGRGEHLSSGP